jgi:hypothetical protein
MVRVAACGEPAASSPPRPAAGPPGHGIKPLGPGLPRRMGSSSVVGALDYAVVTVALNERLRQRAWAPRLA